MRQWHILVTKFRWDLNFGSFSLSYKGISNNDIINEGGGWEEGWKFYFRLRWEQVKEIISAEGARVTIDGNCQFLKTSLMWSF